MKYPKSRDTGHVHATQLQTHSMLSFILIWGILILHNSLHKLSSRAYSYNLNGKCPLQAHVLECPGYQLPVSLLLTFGMWSHLRPGLEDDVSPVPKSVLPSVCH